MRHENTPLKTTTQIRGDGDAFILFEVTVPHHPGATVLRLRNKFRGVPTSVIVHLLLTCEPLSLARLGIPAPHLRMVLRDRGGE